MPKLSRKGLFLLALAVVVAAAAMLALSVPRDERTNDRSMDPSSVALFSLLAEAQSFELPNGLEVVVVPDRNAQRIAHTVWYRIGAVDDPPGKSGLAHFVEHLTFGGTRRFSREAFTNSLEAISTDEGALTAKDHTVFYQTVLPGDLPRAMQLEAERMRNVVFTERSLAAEREEVLEERRESLGHAETALLDALRTALYRGSMFDVPVLGRPVEMATIGLEDAWAFYQSMYAPSNAVVVVHGPVTVDMVRRLAEQYYGTLPGGAAHLRQPTLPLSPAEAQQFVIRDRNVREPVWLRQYVAPSLTEGSQSQVPALYVLQQIIGLERLHPALVLKKALANEVSVEYDAENIGPDSFTIRVTAKQGVDPEEIGRLVDLELQSLLVDGPTADEVARARANPRIDAALFEEDLSLAPQIIGSALARGRKLDDVRVWPKRIASVTREEVHAAVKALLSSPRSATGILTSI